MTAHAPTVARQLKRLGYTTSHDRSIPSIRVTRGPVPGTVVVNVDHDLEDRNQRIGRELAPVLADLGYAVRPSADGASMTLSTDAEARG